MDKYTIKVIDLGISAAKGITCAIPECTNTPDTPGPDALCYKCAREVAEEMDRYQLESLLKDYEPVLYEQYKADHESN